MELINEIQIKKQYFNGRDNVVEIYHDTFKILEIKTNNLWNATESDPITVTYSRYNKGDYIITDVELEKIDEEVADE